MKFSKKVIYLSTIILILSISNSSAAVKMDNTKSVQGKNLAYFSYKDVKINDIFTIDKKEINEESEFFKEDIKYPQLKINNQYVNKNDVHTKSINSINEKIKLDVDKFAKEIKDLSNTYKQDYEKENSKSKEKPMKYQYEAVGDYNVQYNKNNILSIPLTLYQFTGGAHGLTSINSYNYDLDKGKEIQLQDLFKENTKYKEVINKQIQQEIDKNKGIYFNGENGFKGISDNQKFYITDKGIVIYFTLYEIAPYSTGIPTFTITWDEIIDYLENPNISK